MKLIIGGAYQGKVKYAVETYGLRDGWIDGSACERSELETCRGIFRFHEFVKRMIFTDTSMFHMNDLSKLEQQAEAFAAALYEKNPNIVIVSNELGYGIVPMEKKDRMWRELVGRICTALATRSDEVVRVVCGVGIRLK